MLMRYIFTALFFVFSLLASATNYYVSPSGSNSNPGTLANPFKTIVYGISKILPGDILYVRNGTYAERVIVYGHGATEAKPVIIAAYQGESPVIDGGTTLPGFDYGDLVRLLDDYTQLIGFEIRNSNIKSSYLGGDGIVVVGKHCLISHCIVHNCNGSGIGIGGDYSIVENSTVYDVCLNNLNGISDSWGSGISARRAPDYCIIRSCTVHDCWGEGISTFEASHTLIEDNIVFDVFSAMLYTSDATDCLVQRNLVYTTKIMKNGDQVGLAIWDETNNPSSARNVFINNIVYGCRRNCYAEDLEDVIIANNTFVNSIYHSGVLIRGSIKNSIFENNIAIQENTIQCVDFIEDAALVSDHNLYNKPYDVDIQGPGDIIGDPKFTKSGVTSAGNLSAEYFKLLSTSPAINKGVIITKVYDDIFGNKRDAYPDIGANEYNAVDPSVKVNSITVTGTGGGSTISTNNGTVQLIATVLPANAQNKTVRWSIMNSTGQATISTSGLVTAITNGTVTARATANDGSGVYGTLVITISNQAIAVTGITVTGVGGASTITSDGGSLQLSAAILPSNATNKTVTWSITNGSSLASINTSTGLLTAIDNGTVTVRATANDGSEVFGAIAITISYITNSPPVIVVNYKSSSYSGFVSEINASESYDADKDILTFTWTVPDNLQVSSTTGSTLEYLAPMVNTSQAIEFTLKISDGKATQLKVIPIEILPFKPELEMVEIVNIEASSFQSPYYPFNIVDGNIATIWSAEGENQWLVLELEKPFFIHYIKLAFKPGQKSTSYFDIMGSDDKVSWEPVLTKSSSCAFSGDFQVFEFPASKSARRYNYVKFIGRCNSKDKWNYISEFELFGFYHRNLLDFERLEVRIYPNPAKDHITFYVDESTHCPDFMQITSLSGKIIYTSDLEPGIREFTIPVNLKNGIYILKLDSGNFTMFTQKIIISN
jgi:hypothetical protein